MGCNMADSYDKQTEIKFKYTIVWFGLVCGAYTTFNNISVIMTVSFIGAGNQST